MAVIAPPATFGQLQPDLGFDYVYAEQMIRMELSEKLDVLGLGLVQLWAELQGTGSDVARVTRMGGVGWQEAMVELAGETDPIVKTGFRTGFDTVAIARHGLGKSESYQSALLSREPAVLLRALKNLLPASWLKTLRLKWAAVGATFADSVGTPGTPWTFTDELALVAYFHETEGFEGGPGSVITGRHPEQYTDLRASIRAEPNFQFPEITQATQGLTGNGGSFDFLGLRNFSSHDVENSGGDHQGFAYVPGAIGWAVVRTGDLRDEVEDPEKALFVEDFGLVCEWKSEGETASAEFNANAWFGAAKADPTVAPQVRLVSIDD